jgi:anti-anti-sigma factor
MSDVPISHLTTRTTDGIWVLTFRDSQLHGDELAEALRQELLALVTESGAKKMVLDLRNVQYLSSVAFRPLLSLRRKLVDTGGQMVLCNLSPEVEEVFHAVRLISTSRSSPAPFDVQPDVPAAIAHLKAVSPDQ